LQNYNIDDHKLHLHPERVSKWLNGDFIYPLYIEISPSGTCNHRCIFCSMDYMGYKSIFLDTNVAKNSLIEFASCGVKSIMFGGEGEPLLHTNIGDIAIKASELGLDISFTTNAVKLDNNLAEQILPVSSWIKVSCNAGTPKIYSQIHRTNENDFKQVINNIAQAVKIKTKMNLKCTIGIQCILLPDNMNSIIDLAQISREIGVDYLVIKPFTQNPNSLNKKFSTIVYGENQELAHSLTNQERPNFQIIFRSKAMNRWDAKGSSLTRCLAIPFWAYVDANSGIHGCLRHLLNLRFLYGYLNKNSFIDIWQSEQRIKNMHWCMENFDVTECHVTCRMETINNYLHRLRYPQSHDNFI
jgi:molybdenum cofactor biosynthesis enzyme MoaA